MLKSSPPNFCKLWAETFNITLISCKDFCTSMVAPTKALKARWTPKIIPALAPKAITRALDASKDLLNSFTCPVIRPRG